MNLILLEERVSSSKPKKKVFPQFTAGNYCETYYSCMVNSTGIPNQTFQKLELTPHCSLLDKAHELRGSVTE